MYPLKLLERLLVAQSPEAQPRKPVPLGRGMPFSNPSVQETANEQYQLQVRLLLAEVQSQLLGTEGAHEFFVQASRFSIPSFNNLNFCDRYILSYDVRLRHPTWILEYVSNEQPVQGAKELNPFMCHSNQGQGVFTQLPLFQTLSNHNSMNKQGCSAAIEPQFPVLNPSLGLRLERYIDHIARNSRKLYVITGAMHRSVSTVQHLGILADDDDLGRVFYTSFGPNGVAIPSHLYKVVLYEDMNKEKAMEAFLIPNKDKVSQSTNLNKYRLDIDKELPKIERDTGLRFFEIVNRLSVKKPQKLYLDFAG